MACIGMYLPFLLPWRRTAHSLSPWLPSISKRQLLGQHTEEAPHPGYESSEEMGGKRTPRSTILAYLLTERCRVLLEQLTGFQLVKKFPAISRNPKVHYRTHKRPPTVSILGQPNPVHTPTYHLLQIRHNIIHPSTPRSPHWSLSLRFPQQDPIHPPLLTHTLLTTV